jgi:hypothetical protein
MYYYIIIDIAGGAHLEWIITDKDNKNKVFYSEESAKKEAKLCEKGIIIKIKK